MNRDWLKEQLDGLRDNNGRLDRETLKDWLKVNAWRVLTNCYNDIADLLEDVSDYTYGYIVDELVCGESEPSLAEELADGMYDIYDKEE